MASIEQTVKYLRSKNAGPFWLTIDAFCNSEEDARKVFNVFEREKDWIAQAFNVSSNEILLYLLPSIQVAKISFPRRPVQGYRSERDMHGGQQYVTLLDLEV